LAPAISKAIKHTHYGIVSQAMADKDYRKCQAGTLNFYEGIYSGVGSAGACHASMLLP